MHISHAITIERCLVYFISYTDCALVDPSVNHFRNQRISICLIILQNEDLVKVIIE